MGAHSTSCCRGRPRRCWFRFRVMGFGQSAGKGRGGIFFVREDVWRVDIEVGRDANHPQDESCWLGPRDDLYLGLWAANRISQSATSTSTSLRSGCRQRRR